jgi:hypothetical protein
LKHGEIIDKDVVHMSMLPTLEATTYHVMYAFGNHLCVSSGKEHLITRDNSIVVATFEQECVLEPNYQTAYPCKARICRLDQRDIGVELWGIQYYSVFLQLGENKLYK